MKYKFVQKDEQGTVICSFEAHSLDEMLERFEQFLLASGFVFDGKVTIE